MWKQQESVEQINFVQDKKFNPYPTNVENRVSS